MSAPTKFRALNTISFSIPATDPRHFYYVNDNVAGQVTLANVATTTATDDAAIGNIDPDSAHSWFAIRPTAMLPEIIDSVVIDGYTQGASTLLAASPNSNSLALGAGTLGTNAVLRIALEGDAAGQADGLQFGLVTSTVRGLVINRFQGAGVVLVRGGGIVEGNFIGTDPSGTLALGNGVNGIAAIQMDAVRIGGSLPAARNLISANNGDGLDISRGTDTVVAGNLIGTDASGTRSLGNQAVGLRTYQLTNTRIGGAGEGNLISANGNDGMILSDVSDTTIQGNFVGTDITGILDLGNASDGIEFDVDPRALIGGTTAGAANVIAFNDQSGIEIQSTFNRDIAILGNSIFGNGNLGIDLRGGTQDTSGVTANDAGDGDTGANNLQNYPVLTAATATATNLTIEATLNSTPSTSFRVEFFANAAADSSGHGEGQTFLARWSSAPTPMAMQARSLL